MCGTVPVISHLTGDEGTNIGIFTKLLCKCKFTDHFSGIITTTIQIVYFVLFSILCTIL
jgi:hypothetical protein